MPIYNDNRQLLGSFEHRMLVEQALVSMIKEEGIKPEFIAGTMTAGVAPAASVANRLGIPLVIYDNATGKALAFPTPPIAPLDISEVDAIASTSPIAIPYGVTAANGMQLPFLYARQKAKEHGLEQQIEGVVKKGWNVALMDMRIGDGYLNDAKAALEEIGLSVPDYQSVVTWEVIPADLRGRTGVVIEDLISTGGSSAKEVKQFRELGADIELCCSIFNYNLDTVHNAFGKLTEPCLVKSALTYDVLLAVAKERGYVTPEEIELLEEWREAPFEWGERHGFPPVLKNE
ncbi:hypothetical protein GOV07_01100 [Candidatus Woesearchaeota archaeon]|nr:hypothetical protein [Candidatus Woesearchaeota archaeon]